MRRLAAEAFVILLGLLVLGLAVASPETLAPATGPAGGTLRGQVLDPSGAAVPAASVEVDGPGGHRAARTPARSIELQARVSF